MKFEYLNVIFISLLVMSSLSACDKKKLLITVKSPIILKNRIKEDLTKLLLHGTTYFLRLPKMSYSLVTYIYR